MQQQIFPKFRMHMMIHIITREKQNNDSNSLQFEFLNKKQGFIWNDSLL